MPATSVYGFGSNLFDNCVPGGPLDILNPTLLPGAQDVVTCSWSETFLTTKDGTVSSSQGLKSFTGDDDTAILDSKTLIGQESFIVRLSENNQLVSVEGSVIGDESKRYSLATMNGRGEILAVELVSSNVVLFHSISGNKSINLPFPSALPILSIRAGAGHFLLMTSTEVFSYGDNRFGQCGTHSSQTSSLSAITPLAFFEGLSPPRYIATGDLHSCVVTQDGALYIFGSDKEGQCGGYGGLEPSMVDLGDVNVDMVVCGSGHTVCKTDDGQVWVTGLSE